MKQKVTTICSYCKADLGTKEHDSDREDHITSHGICKPCKNKAIRQMRRDKALSRIASLAD